MKIAPHVDSLLVPKPTEAWRLDDADEVATMHETNVKHDVYLDVWPFLSGKPHLITHSDLD